MKQSILILFVFLGCISADVIYSENFNSRASWSTNGTYTTWVWSNISSIIQDDYTPDMIYDCPQLSCWSTPIPYEGMHQASVTSPSINASGFVNLSVSFDVVWDTETSWDGANFAYSTNQGATWTVVGIPSWNDTIDWWYNQWDGPNDPNAPLEALAWTGQTYGWSGRQNEGTRGRDGNFSSPGWVHAYHVLPRILNDVPEIQFQFNFGSDGTGWADGFAFDNFELSGASTRPKTSSMSSSEASGTRSTGDVSSAWKMAASMIMTLIFVFFL
eukprot:TRINITY_DN19824_c0_g1_i1.p1 TRINITY_DN19824_c0_g1~~TRINITY_DN19824_c0_g1_i1.p1  ORF type:complete len:272 (+),score=30.69 TRINITY_DN19824_c0_g1_i1:136-951(+)